MECNSKHILKRNSKGERWVSEWLDYVNDKIKDDSHKILHQTGDEHNHYKKNMTHMTNINLV